MMAALSILFGYVETLIPLNFGIPGIKLGLANIVILLLLYRYSWKEALPVTLARILVIGFMFGNMFSIVYSLAGALLSMLVMSLLIRSGRFRIIGISAAGGAAHNVGQILAAYAVTTTLPLFWYLPILMIAGTLTGILIGILVGLIHERTSGL